PAYNQYEFTPGSVRGTSAGCNPSKVSDAIICCPLNLIKNSSVPAKPGIVLSFKISGGSIGYLTITPTSISIHPFLLTINEFEGPPVERHPPPLSLNAATQLPPKLSEAVIRGPDA